METSHLSSGSYLSARKPLQSDMAQFQPQWRNLCCNPFNKPHHFIRKKSQLMVITERMCEKVPSILLAWGENL